MLLLRVLLPTDPEIGKLPETGFEDGNALVKELDPPLPPPVPVTTLSALLLCEVFFTNHLEQRIGKISHSFPGQKYRTWSLVE